MYIEDSKRTKQTQKPLYMRIIIYLLLGLSPGFFLVIVL